MENNEMSLKEKWSILCKYKKWILLFPICVSLAAAVYASKVERIWESNTTVRIGQVAQVRLTSPTAIALQMKNDEFVNAVLDRLSQSGMDSEMMRSVYKKGISVNITRDYEIVEIKFRAPSRELVQSLGRAAADQFQEDEAKSFQSQDDSIRERVRLLQAGVSEARALLPGLQKKIDSANGLLYSVLLQSKTMEIHELLKELFYLKDKMRPAHTFPTYIVGDVSVSSVTRSRLSIVVMSFLFSLLVSIAVSFLYEVVYLKD